jgi:DNA-binding MarR family transcriptional regulator
MEDEVDRLVGGWRRALPDVDVSPLEVLSRVTRLARHLDRQRTVGLRPPRPRDVVLRRALRPTPFRPPPSALAGQLLAQTLVTSGTMTNRIDHLEQRGLVRRRPDPDDARSVRVQLTAAGRRRVDLALQDLVTARTPSWERSTPPNAPLWPAFSAESSPPSTPDIVYTPQKGKAITALYLRAAGATFPGDGPAPTSGAGGAATAGFHYTKEVLAGDTAVLEFETTIEGKYVNGVDIIRANAAGRIVEFRVMIRPLQAVNLVHQQMAAMLERMKPAD